RQGPGKADKSPREGNRTQQARRDRHPAFPQASVDPCEGPVALADHADAVGTRHSAEAGQGRGVSLFELGQEGGGVHPAMIATARAARQVPGGPFRTFGGPRSLPAPAREEAEQREHEDHDEDDPEDAHAISCLLVVSICRPARSDSAWDQRKNLQPRYAAGRLSGVIAQAAAAVSRASALAGLVFLTPFALEQRLGLPIAA